MDNFYEDDLEVFLKQTADEHTMYPSEKVWKGVRKNLFWHKNRYSITGSILALCLLFVLPESFFTFFNNTPGTTSKSKKSNTTLFSSPAAGLKAIRGNISPIAVNTAPVVNNPALFVAAKKEPVTQNARTHIKQLHRSGIFTQPATLLHDRNEIQIAAPFAESIPVKEEKEVTITNPNTQEETPEQYHGDVNWLQELAVIKLTHKKQSRFNLQFYFSPLVSYRTLTDNDHNTHTSTMAGPVAASQININQYVDHQPSMGVELGSNVLLRAGNNLTIKSGLQLNYSRYTIKAYKAGYQKASIALNSFGRMADTMTSYTTLRNFNGYIQEQLQNQYLQISLPIGAELKLLGNKRFQINVAGTIQPTYLLLNDTYLLSTDYINYTKEPSLVRRWNVHSSAEAYISYQFAKVRWQVGPQFRYQLMSSFNDRYPIKEYLMEYGIKFGISKTLK